MESNKLIILARLLLTKGVNLQENQILYLKSNLELKDFTSIVIEEAYSYLKAKYVYVEYLDSKQVIIRSNQQKNYLLPDFIIENEINILKSNAAILTLDCFSDDLISEKMIFNDAKAKKKIKEIKSKLKNNSCKTIIPTLKWAQKIYPELNSQDALEELWDVYFDICLVKKNDPFVAWSNKLKEILVRKSYLNEQQFKKLMIKTKKTCLELELIDQHVWVAGQEEKQKGILTMPNFPTEEIFTCPSKYNVSGIVYNTKPLVFNNQIIDKFYLEFESGKIIDYAALVNQELLESILKDENMRYLAEIALVSASSPIAQQKTIFYHTLIDENAAAHLALGNSLSCNSLVKKQTAQMNQALLHIDFMFGDKDLEVKAIKEDKEIILMKDGEWKI